MQDRIRALLDQGIVLQKKGQHEKARALYEEVLERHPDEPDAIHLMGLSHFDVKCYEDAYKLFAKSLQLRPDVPHFHHNFAALLSIKGDTAAAEGHYREAIRLNPKYAEAFYNLASIVRLRAHDPLIDQAESLLAGNDLSPGDECFLHFAAGKLLDDIGDWRRAFSHYSRGNTKKAAVYHKRRLDTYASDLRRVFSEAFLKEARRHAIRTSKAVFVIGMPRSGTSLIEQILSCHSQIHGAGEISDISSIANALKKHTGERDDYPSAINHTDPEILRGMAKSYLEKLDALGAGARHVINKMPLNFWHLGLISCMFSHPVILHCRRDPLDTCLSCYFQNFTNGQEFSFDLDNLAHFHGLYDDMMQHWRRVLPIPFVEFRYEDLVENPDALAKRILEFIGLEWEDACGKPHESRRVVETASRWQVRQPVYKTSRNRANNYRPYLAPLIDGLAARADQA